jgi:hypothetical protein
VEKESLALHSTVHPHHHQGTPRSLEIKGVLDCGPGNPQFTKRNMGRMLYDGGTPDGRDVAISRKAKRTVGNPLQL